MAQYMLVAFALVCVLLVAEARVLKKNVLTERVLAAHKSFSKKGSLGTSTSDTFNLRDGGALSTAGQIVTGEHSLTDALGNAGKRGLKTPFSSPSNGKSPKKSYHEVFFAAEFIDGMVFAYTFAPCSVGVIAFADILADVDWEAVDWEAMTEQHVQAHVLAFVEWWTENKCTEFFHSLFAFNHYVWSIFWDDLEETECGRQLPHKGGSIDWTRAFQHRNSLDPTAWENVPEPETECEVFELVGEIFLDFFFPFMFDAMPEAVLEDMFNDFGVNDEIDPYFGYAYLEQKYGSEFMDGQHGPPDNLGDKKRALLSLLKAKKGQ